MSTGWEWSGPEAPMVGRRVPADTQGSDGAGRPDVQTYFDRAVHRVQSLLRQLFQGT